MRFRWLIQRNPSRRIGNRRKAVGGFRPETPGLMACRSWTGCYRGCMSNRIDSRQDGQVRVVATSPEGLVSLGDLGKMRRYVLMSTDQDQARAELFHAAGNSLVKLQDGRIMRLALYGWPVAVSFSRQTSVFSSMRFGQRGQTEVMQRLRGIWSEVFGSRSGVGISPLLCCTHLNGLLGMSPLLVRDCVRHGNQVLAGKKADRAWTFDREDQPLAITAYPEMPAVFILGAYVAWDYLDDPPAIDDIASAAERLSALCSALFSSRTDVMPQVVAGNPAPFHVAVERAHALQIAETARHAMSMGKGLSVLAGRGVVPETATLTVVIGDEYESDDAVSFEFCYCDAWRMATHHADLANSIQQVQDAMSEGVLAPRIRQAAAPGLQH